VELKQAGAGLQAGVCTKERGSAWEALACNPSHLGSDTPISKITRTKQTGGGAQVIERLLFKHEAMFQIPVPTKKEEVRGCEKMKETEAEECKTRTNTKG
jgi:hypothetical protein